MKTLKQIKQEMNVIAKQRRKIYKEDQKLISQYQKFQREYYNKKYSMKPSIEIICKMRDWNKLPYENLYKKFSNYLTQEHPYIYKSGFNPLVKQILFSLTQWNNPGQDFAKLEYLLTLIRTDSNGRKRIDILNASCGEGESYQLINGTIIEKTAWGRTSVVCEFPTVGEALNWIYANLFVSKDEENDDS